MYNYLPLAICGGSLGWLVGLSVSDTITIIIGSFCTLLVTILTAIVGIDKSSTTPNNSILKTKFNLIPLATFMFFFSVGSTLGIITRTHGYLAPTEKTDTSNLDQKLKNKEPKTDSMFNPYLRSKVGALYSTSSNLCENICGDITNVLILRSHLENSGITDIKNITPMLSDSAIILFSRIECGCSL